MRIRDISVKKRLLFANFSMVFICVCALAIIGAAIFAGLSFTGAIQQRELEVLWPEKGRALSIQFAVDSLRAKADKKGDVKLHGMLEYIHILEAQGINTLVLRDNQIIYKTPNADAAILQNSVTESSKGNKSVLRWDEDGFIFCYTSERSNTTIMAAGLVPFLGKGSASESNARDILEGIILFLLALAIIFIIVLGFYLSRFLSKQILEPLSALRLAASEIQKGNMDAKLEVQTQDELGETCQAFERMRQELKNARKTQQHYEQNRKELIAGISHDLSTPLTSVKGYASGILDGIAKTKEKQQHYIEMIYQKACVMEKLVESLFLFSKLDLGHLPFHLETADICAYFRDLAADLQPLLTEKGVQLETQVLEKPVFIKLDRVQFQRVVENLLENSIKYKKDKSVQLKISLLRQDNNIKIAFADNGSGVPAGELEKIFEGFYRTDPARANVAKGSGLGLAIVRQIILGFHGKIWAQQTEGGGLTVCILLPIAEKNI